jgi:predicted nuclease of restriction endonuclease-like (RecB) superfamily
MNIQKYNSATGQIREAILRSQHRTVSAINREQLSLYYGIGRYVSQNSRKDFWGTGAIENISEQLQKELPSLRGFSPENIKKMRRFYEEWDNVLFRSPMATEIQDIDFVEITNRSPLATDLQYSENKLIINRQTASGELGIDENILLLANRQPTTGDFDWNKFLQLGFSLHMEIINKTNSTEARLFYIHECATRFWNKYTLRDYLKADLYGKRGTMPNNFEKAIPNAKLALKAVVAFKDEYLPENLRRALPDMEDLKKLL